MPDADSTIATLISNTNGAIKDLAIDPLALAIDQDGARALAVMRESALWTRSRGPYTADAPPPEAVEMVRWVALQSSMLPYHIDINIEGGGLWPSVLMRLSPHNLVVRYVVPEDVPADSQSYSGDGTLWSDVRMALEYVEHSLRAATGSLGTEPPVALTLSYPNAPNYEEELAALPEKYRHLIPPVHPLIEVDRSRCSTKQRTAHDAALRAVACESQTVEPLGRRGFTTRIGRAVIQDGGS